MRSLSQLIPQRMDEGVRLGRLSRTVHERCRNARWETYVRAFPPRPDHRVLDVGVSPLVDLPSENFFLRNYPFPTMVTGVTNDTNIEPIRTAFPHATIVTADGLALPFGSGEFDVVHSNAVIEHVGPAEYQRRFMGELIRVGRSGFVSTPERWFPVDSHTNLPFIHWLPRPAFLWALRRAGRLTGGQEWLTWLLSGRDLARRVPAGVQFALVTQRLAGLPAVVTVIFRHRDAPVAP